MKKVLKTIKDDVRAVGAAVVQLGKDILIEMFMPFYGMAIRACEIRDKLFDSKVLIPDFVRGGSK